METENETVEQACHVLYAHPEAEAFDGEFTVLNNNKIADHILAAHKRDIADFQRRYDECVRRFNEADLERVRLRDEVAAKDSEIANLKWKVENYAQVVAAKDAEIAALKACHDGECERIRLGAEPCAGCHVQMANDGIAKLRALVKELADALWDENGYSYQKLIAKAREVCK